MDFITCPEFITLTAMWINTVLSAMTEEIPLDLQPTLFDFSNHINLFQAKWKYLFNMEDVINWAISYVELFYFFH